MKPSADSFGKLYVCSDLSILSNFQPNWHKVAFLDIEQIVTSVEGHRHMPGL